MIYETIKITVKPSKSNNDINIIKSLIVNLIFNFIRPLGMNFNKIQIPK